MFLHGSCVDASEAVTDDVNADRSRVKCEAYRQFNFFFFFWDHKAH